MKIQFLGGASRVGSLGLLVEIEDGRKILFDYGLTPTSPPEFPIQAPPVDLVLLTHAHVDHSGMIPWVTSKYSPTVVATHPTTKVARVLATDSHKISGIEGYPIPYNDEDVKDMMRYFDLRHFGEVVEYGTNTTIELHRAGHIPGATMYEVDGITNLLFTGDINTIDTHLVKKANPVSTEVLFIESTYAGREHEDRNQLVDKFIDTIESTIDRGGKVIIPAFAVGRTQEILLILSSLDYNIFLDGMGKTVTRFYKKERPSYVKDPGKLNQISKRVNLVRSQRARERAINEAEIIVTTSGMLDGGPVMSYIPALGMNERNSILLTGYQVDGTNGRMLMDTGYIDIAGVSVRPKAKVEFYDFSAHAGHSQLLDFIHSCDPSTVVLMHGDNREELAKDLDNYNVYMPMEDEVLDIKV